MSLNPCTDGSRRSGDSIFVLPARTRSYPGSRRSLRIQRGGVEQGQEEPEVEKPRKRKSLIDTEKLLALRKAGWNVKQISEELGCSMQSVYKVLNKARQKEEERREADRAKIKNTH